MAYEGNMDAFEQLVSEILWMDGLWVRTSVRVEITKEEERFIRWTSSPRIGDRQGYENQVSAVVAKLLLRGKTE